MRYNEYIYLIPLLPFLGFVLLGLFGRKTFKHSAGHIATFFLLIATALSIYTAYNYFFVDGKVNGDYQTIIPLKMQWLEFSPNVSIDMGIILDPISVMMLVVVTFVSLMVHIFSLWYMKGEERYGTYYAFLGLFTFSMLGLVVASNLFQVYMFWELVGVSSYLLIGYYFDKPSAVAASKKAFIVTRFADLGFLIGILILAFYGETLDIPTLIERLTSQQSSQFIAITTASFVGVSMLTWGLTLVFIGGAGKSAMFPLHIWLPDAMEGPTPVSALIHAATMVVAGVYLVARLFPLFIQTAAALSIVTYVGLISALIAAIIACTQTDIKRVLAYSTMSQIGYMMFSLGVSGYLGSDGEGYTASMFHLFTHAFFKSLLFLAAGAVIHLVHSNEMRDMGGLKRYMPVTHLVFLLACLAISGIPPFSGFFSKESILLAAYHSNQMVYWIGLITSGLTAFYMFRLYFSIFWNKPKDVHHTYEGNGTMKLPLIMLAILTVVSGFIPFGSFITPDGRPVAGHFDIMFSILPVAVGVAGILLAWWMYKTANERPQRIRENLGGLYTMAKRKFYIDEIWMFFTKKIIFNLIGRPAAWIDRNVVDGTMNGIAYGTAWISQTIRRFQSGKIQTYSIIFFVGAILLAGLIIYLNKV